MCKYCSLEYKTKGEKAECHICHNTFTKKINDCLFCDLHYRGSGYINPNSWAGVHRIIYANQNLKSPEPKTGKRPYWVYPYG